MEQKTKFELEVSCDPSKKSNLSAGKSPRSLQKQFARLSRKRKRQVLELARRGDAARAREAVAEINLSMDNQRRIANVRYSARVRKAKVSLGSIHELLPNEPWLIEAIQDI